MLLALIAWLYVTLLMGLVEATAPQGTVFGGLTTFLFYGVLPAALVGYILATPARKRALRARQEAERVATSGGTEPDAGGHAPAAAEADGVAPVRKEP
ncbi:MAG: hypothetical protein LT082_13740 [Comamonas sp.]|jgi:hypothetical protein|nr:hypothetical protein [Comamonas sp.]